VRAQFCAICCSYPVVAWSSIYCRRAWLLRECGWELTTGCIFSVVMIWFRCLSNRRVGDDEWLWCALPIKDGCKAPEFKRSVNIELLAWDSKWGGNICVVVVYPYGGIIWPPKMSLVCWNNKRLLWEGRVKNGLKGGCLCAAFCTWKSLPLFLCCIFMSSWLNFSAFDICWACYWWRSFSWKLIFYE